VISAGSLSEGFFGCLTELKSISLSMTRLSSFPMELTSMTNLTYIDVSQNAIERLPEEITNLSKLEYLDVSNNSISTLPPQIGFMDPVLKTFQVEGMLYVYYHTRKESV